MTLRRLKAQGTDWNRRYRRDYELDRAAEKFRNAALILVFGFVVFAMAFTIAWDK